jgi:uncharacterized HAD superfamily protein
MKKLNLCIDIDGTVTEPYFWLKYANQHFNRSITPEDLTSYAIEDILGIEKEAFSEFYEKYGPLLHSEAEVRPGVHETLERLYRDHDIHFITARALEMHPVSLEWLQRHKLPLDSLTLLGSHDKVGKAAELSCDIFVEDRYENAVQLAEAGFLVLLIDCTYNQGDTPANVVRVKDWPEIGTVIDQHAQKVI